MTEQKKRKPLGRTALIALAACAALIGSASAANAVTDGEFFEHLSNYIQVNVFKSVAVSDEGETITMINMTATIENRDGRAILVVPGDEVDITDALNETGEYHYEHSDNGTVCEVNVTGTPEKWVMRTAVYDEGEEPSVVLISDSEEDSNMVVTGNEEALEALEPGETFKFAVATFSNSDDCEMRGDFMIEQGE